MYRASFCALVCAFISEVVLTALPVPYVPAATVSGNRNTDLIIQLRSSIEIPDGSELHWPIQVPSSFVVKHVRVVVHDLYHQEAGDLEISLRRGVHSVELLSQLPSQIGQKRLGRPEPKLQRQLPTERVQGKGYGYIFEDVNSVNLALHRPTLQSSTAYGGLAGRAVDGNTNGFYSSDSVTHTAGDQAHYLDPDLQHIRRDADIGDPEPYWQVDLAGTTNGAWGSGPAVGAAGSDVSVGTIRLWNRVQEPNTDEIQVITTTASGPLTGGSFKVQFNNSGSVVESGPIDGFAVASIEDESPSNSIGGRPGESMQSRLEAMANIGRVRVSRFARPGRTGQYVWSVTFRSEAGDLQPLTVTANDLTGFAARADVTTYVNGNGNTWYNYKHPLQEVSGRLFPCWVMVLSNVTGVKSLQDALDKSSFKVKLSAVQQETYLSLPPGVKGRYVRVQLTEPNYLTIAEVQVYSDRQTPVSGYLGGDPVSPATYQPQESLDQTYGQTDSFGQWLLVFKDLEKQQLLEQTNSLSSVVAHGRGAVGWWRLELEQVGGGVHVFEADLSFTVTHLPTFGTLFKYNAVNKTVGTAFSAVTTQQQYLSNCLDVGCSSQFGVGNPLSTDTKGSTAEQPNRITASLHDRTLVYRPKKDWLGADKFYVRSIFGVTQSAEADVTVNTRKCRVKGAAGCDAEFFNDIALRQRADP